VARKFYAYFLSNMARIKVRQKAVNVEFQSYYFRIVSTANSNYQQRWQMLFVNRALTGENTPVSLSQQKYMNLQGKKW
jgi:hypothetical protein